MLLTFSIEKGDGGRKIEITGKNNNGAKWFVTIDGQPAADGNGGKNGQTVKVRTGDKITWIIAAVGNNTIMHGVAFAEQNLAEAMLTFDLPDAKTGQPLKL